MMTVHNDIWLTYELRVLAPLEREFSRWGWGWPESLDGHTET